MGATGHPTGYGAVIVPFATRDRGGTPTGTGEPAPSRRRTAAAHVYWSAPIRRRSGPEAEPDLTPLELLVAAVSALAWRRWNGPVHLHTDAPGRAFFERKGLLGFWDSVDTELLESIPPGVDVSVFWDIGKVFALCRRPGPSVVLDLDLIVWTALGPRLSAPVQFLHWEELVAPWYVDPPALSRPPGYRFDPGLDWGMWACNTSLMYAEDEAFREAFARASLAFAEGNRPAGGPAVAELLFCGQRLFGMTARRLGVEARPLLPYCFVPCGRSRWLIDDPPMRRPLAPLSFLRGSPITHLWAAKHRLRAAPAASARFGRLLVGRLRQDDPAGAGRLAGIPDFGPFVEGPA